MNDHRAHLYALHPLLNVHELDSIAEFVLIINAGKVIFEIRADQEYKCQLSVLSSADCETLNSTMDEVEQERWRSS